MRFLLFFLVIIPVCVSGQDTPVVVFRLKHQPYTLKLDATELINPFIQSATLQANIPIARQWAIEAGVGYTFDSWVYAPRLSDAYQGIRLRTGLLFFLQESGQSNSYIALAFKYNRFQNDRYVLLSRQGAQYNEAFLFKRTLEDVGVGLRFGTQVFWGENKRILFEPFFGLGVRRRQITTNSFPADGEQVEQRRIFAFGLGRGAGIYDGLDVLAGIFFGYRLGRD